MLKPIRLPAIMAMFALCCLILAPSSVSAQTQWGALAYNDRGATGLVWKRPTQERAEADAMRICGKNATVPCRVVAGAGHACIASTLGNRPRGGRQAAFSAVRVGLNQARNAALVACLRRNYNKCRMRNFMCSDGSHKR